MSNAPTQQNPHTVLSATADSYGDSYREHVLEQYKLYFGSIEKNSDRRQISGQIFFTVNTALFALVGFSFELGNPVTKLAARVSIAVAGIVICVVFYHMIKAHKQLASGKFKVLKEIEALLPLKPFSTEWAILGEGKDRKKYFSFSKVEVNLPIIFAIGYILFGVVSVYFFKVSQVGP